MGRKTASREAVLLVIRGARHLKNAVYRRILKSARVKGGTVLASLIYYIYCRISRTYNAPNKGDCKHRERRRFGLDKPEGRSQPDNQELRGCGVPPRPVPWAGLQVEDPKDCHADLQLGEDGLHGRKI